MISETKSCRVRTHFPHHFRSSYEYLVYSFRYMEYAIFLSTVGVHMNILFILLDRWNLEIPYCTLR